MPFIQVTMLAGRTAEQKHALIRAVTQAAVDTVNTTPDNVRVAIYEVSTDEWGVAGDSVTEIRQREAH